MRTRIRSVTKKKPAIHFYKGFINRFGQVALMYKDLLLNDWDDGVAWLKEQPEKHVILYNGDVHFFNKKKEVVNKLHFATEWKNFLDKNMQLESHEINY